MQLKTKDKDINSRNTNDEEVPMTRRERKQARKEKRTKKEKKRRPIRRIFPIWLRIIIILLGCFGALIAGLMVGYGVLGEGVPKDALNKETWQHIIDIIRKTE